MLYTLENVYLQPANNHSPNILYNIISSQPSPIIYIQRPLPSYTYLHPIRTRYILPIKSFQSPAIKQCSEDLLEKERSKSPPMKTPLTSEEQLDLNLSQYGYRREFVNGDGNCFFTAVASQLMSLYQRDRSFRLALRNRLNLPENLFLHLKLLARTLRKLVCLEWKNNQVKYQPYINDVNYSEEIQKFRSDKFYSSVLGDILPLTISNLMGIHLKIITSLDQCPLIEVCPQDDPLLSMKSTPILTLAYNQENDGHYDIALQKIDKEY